MHAQARVCARSASHLLVNYGARAQDGIFHRNYHAASVQEIKIAVMFAAVLRRNITLFSFFLFHFVLSRSVYADGGAESAEYETSFRKKKTTLNFNSILCIVRAWKVDRWGQINTFIRSSPSTLREKDI